jgi:hypothetical protein
MSLRGMMKDRVTLIKKKDGRRFEDMRASVQRDKIFTADTEIPIEEGDFFERVLPNGIVEQYTILDAGFYVGSGRIPAHYQSNVRKQTRIDAVQPPTISDEDYEYILRIIRHQGRTFETTPKTYEVHDEEELRDMLLANLNSHYEGQASGETFRKQGKTDIRIEDKNRVAFVAECKVWEGTKKLSGAVDQILAYLTWRDCKASMIIFNKTVSGFSAIRNKVPEILTKHPNFVSQGQVDQLGEWRFRFKSPEDAQRLIIVHVFLFNLYVG